MKDGFYSTGQVARELGVSQDMIRSLIIAGAIAAQTTPGGQSRIHSKEMVRLRRNGIPELERPMPREESRPARRSAAAPAEPGVWRADAAVAWADGRSLIVLRCPDSREYVLDHDMAISLGASLLSAANKLRPPQRGSKGAAA